MPQTLKELRKAYKELILERVEVTDRSIELEPKKFESPELLHEFIQLDKKEEEILEKMGHLHRQIESMEKAQNSAPSAS